MVDSGATAAQPYYRLVTWKTTIKAVAGTLYVVATPIGNLEDITLRALRILKEVDLIACEDTRQTQKLLKRYGIRRPVWSYHEHNEAARSSQIVTRLERGENVALVSDAGTPLLADPGYRLVCLAAERGFKVTPIPGPSSLTAALSACGLTVDAFFFAGFLPAKSGKRQEKIEALARLPTTIVFFEAPHRILDTLQDLARVAGGRPVAVARELTKVHEEILRGTAASVLDQLRRREAVKGEFVVVLGKSETAPASSLSLEESYRTLLDQGLSRMEAIKQAARRVGITKREAYAQLSQLTRASQE